MGAAIALAGWEWSNISGITSIVHKIVYTVLLALLMLAFYTFGGQELYVGVAVFAAMFWIIALAMIVRFQKTREEGFRLPCSALYFGPVVLVPAWLSLVVLHGYEPAGPEFVLLLMILVWIADIAAYFSGKKWGKTKLCDKVSPGKSREGVYGALLAVVTAADGQ